jgi:MFS family permease
MVSKGFFSTLLMAMTQVSPELRHGRNRLAAIVVVGHAIKHIYNSGLQSLLLPEIKIGMGLSGAQFGLLISARQFTSWGTTMGAGYLGDRFTNRAPMMLGVSLGLIGVSFYAAGHAPNYWIMLGAMLLIGLGPSLYHPPALGELSRRFPDRRGFAISLHGTGGIAGEVLGPLVTAGLLAWMSWRGVLQVGLFPALVAGLVIWGTMRTLQGTKVGAASARGYFLSLGTLMRNRVILLLVLLSALRSIADTAVGGFLPVYLREDLEFSELRVALYLSLSHIAGLGAQPAMGFMSDRLGRKAVLVPGMAAVALLSYGLSLADTGTALAIIIIAKGAFTFSLHHIFIAAALDAARGHIQSTVVALMYGAAFLGTFSPYVAGLIVDQFDTRSAFIYGGSVALLATVVLLALRLPSTAQQIEVASRG